MKKSLLLAAVAAVFAVSSCKKDSKEAPDPFKLEYSNLTTEQQKQQLEQSGQEFVQKMDALPDQKFISVLDYFAQLDADIASESPDLDMVLNVSAASKKKDVKAVFKAATTSATTGNSSLSDFYGIYTWNKQTEEWDETSSADRLEFKFPSSASSTTNNASLTLTYKKSNVDFGGEEGVELPGSVSAVLKVDNKDEFSASSKYEYKSDGTPTKVEVNLALGVYSFKTSVSNSVSSASTSFSFFKGNDKLLGLSTSAKGNMSVNEAVGSEDVNDIISNANVTFEIMNLKLAGVLDFKAVEETENVWNKDLADSVKIKEEAKIWNKYSQIVAINTTTNTVIAKNEFVAAHDTYEQCYDNGWETACDTYTDYYLEPRLIFKDNSKVSIDSFFESGFGSLIDDLEEFGDRF